MEAWQELKQSVDKLDYDIRKACHAYAHISGNFHEQYYGWFQSYQICHDSGHAKWEDPDTS